MNTKNLLSLSLILIGIIGILHYFGIFVKGMNYLTEIGFIEQEKKKTEEIINIEKEEVGSKEKYLKELKQYDDKISSLVTYYIDLKKKSQFCSNEIKSYQGLNLNNKKGYNISYEVFIKGIPGTNAEELRKIIVCNIYNSEVQDLYLRIPYSYVKFRKVEPVFQNFIKMYSSKGYKINLIFTLDRLTYLQKHSNVISWLGIGYNTKINSLSFIYKTTKYKESNLEMYYKFFQKVNSFYLESYSKTRNISYSYGITSITEEMKDKEEIIDLWFKTLFKLEEQDIETLLVKGEETKRDPLNSFQLIDIYDKEVLSSSPEETGYTQGIINLLSNVNEDYQENKLSGNLLFNFDLSYDLVKKIDWFEITKFVSSKSYVQVILPNSYSLETQGKFEDDLDKIKNQYALRNILSTQDLELTYYKYKTLYLEKTKDLYLKNITK